MGGLFDHIDASVCPVGLRLSASPVRPGVREEPCAQRKAKNGQLRSVIHELRNGETKVLGIRFSQVILLIICMGRRSGLPGGNSPSRRVESDLASRRRRADIIAASTSRSTGLTGRLRDQLRLARLDTVTGLALRRRRLVPSPPSRSTRRRAAMTTLSYASYRQRAAEGFESLAATLLARRTAGDTPGSDEIKSLTLAVLNGVGATRSQQAQETKDAEHAEEKWQIEAKQAALTRALEVVVEQSVPFASQPSLIEPLS